MHADAGAGEPHPAPPSHRRPRCLPSAADANYDAVIECVPTCCGPDNPAKYPPIQAGEWLMGRLRATHTEHALDSAATA